MKKILSITLALALCCILLVACGDTGGGETESPSASPTPALSEEPTPTPTPEPTPTPTPTPTQTPEASPSATPSESASDEASASPSASADTAGDSTVLKLKSEGDAVTELQERLEALGYLDKVTGYYGTETESAVKSFQKNNGLDVDGEAGPATQEAIMSQDAVEAS